MVYISYNYGLFMRFYYIIFIKPGNVTITEANVALHIKYFTWLQG